MFIMYDQKILILPWGFMVIKLTFHSHSNLIIPILTKFGYSYYLSNTFSWTCWLVSSFPNEVKFDIGIGQNIMCVCVTLVETGNYFLVL